VFLLYNLFRRGLRFVLILPGKKDIKSMGVVKQRDFDCHCCSYWKCMS